MKNNWQTGGYKIVKGSILLGLLVSWIALRYLRFPFLLVVVVFLFVVLLVYDRAAVSRNRTAKTYSVSLDDARQVVLNVLNEKGIPFTESGDYFFMIENEVEIRLLPSSTRGVVGTAVSLTPKSPESQQLIFSLRQKLDEAFRPRGL
ncbi:MAG: hypothetical protein DHS20C20_26780 [Ardenticatenaceae bacterium]|nr:MAG: hypothetical protein DHS20C20_26780 [Ardenticatenaceae bacterium]